MTDHPPLHRPRRSPLPAALVVAVLLASAPAAHAYPKTHVCKNVSVVLAKGAKSRTTGIRSTAYSCRRARVIVRACLRSRLKGWRVSTAPSPDDRDPKGTIGLDRGSAHVSFQFVGRRSCAS